MKTIIIFALIIAGLSDAQTGNVGINTATPQRTLHVNGSLQITNELNVGGNATTAGNAGTIGQVLQSQGAGATPVWKNPGFETAVLVTGNLNYPANNTTYNVNQFSAPTENSDSLGEYSGNTFTAQSSGIYQINYSISFDVRSSANDGGDGYAGYLYLYKLDGITVLQGNSGKVSLPESGGAGGFQTEVMSTMVKLNAGEGIQFKALVFGATGGNTSRYKIDIVRVY